MKKLAVLALAAVVSTSAFAIKIGVVDSEEVFRNYSRTKTLQENLTKEKNRLENEIKAKEVTLQKMQVELQAKGAAVTDADKTKFQREVEVFQKFISDSQTKLGKEESTRIQEIENAMNTAISNVVKNEKFDYILEAGAIRAGGEDVTKKVLAELEKNTKK